VKWDWRESDLELFHAAYSFTMDANDLLKRNPTDAERELVEDFRIQGSVGDKPFDLRMHLLTRLSGQS